MKQKVVHFAKTAAMLLLLLGFSTAAFAQRVTVKGVVLDTEGQPIIGAGVTIKGCSHITGGGFYENIPRMLPEGVCTVVKKNSYEIPAIFKLMAKAGNIAEEMMYNTFNMGLGMIVAVDPADVDRTIAALQSAGEEAYLVGQVEAGNKGVTLC